LSQVLPQQLRKANSKQLFSKETKTSSSMVQLSQVTSDLSQDINRLAIKPSFVPNKFWNHWNWENYLTLDSQVTNLKETVSLLEWLRRLGFKDIPVEGQYAWLHETRRTESGRK